VTPRVLIAGGGISGLALAHRLRKSGIEPLVLEAAGRAGGKIRSERNGGYLCEWGPAGLLDREPEVARLIGELGLERHVATALPAARRRFVVAGQRLLAVPGSAGELLRTPLLAPAAKLRVLGDLAVGRGPCAHGGEESVADFARRRLGRGAAERLFYPLVSGMYAGDPEQISIGAALPWLVELERRDRSLLLGGLRMLAGARRRPGRGLISFAEGLEELPRALARELGDRLELDATLERIERVDGSLRAGVCVRGQRRTLAADALVLALPAPEASRAVAPLVPELCAPLHAIPYTPVALVYLGYPPGALARPPDGYGFLVAPGESPGLLGAVFASAVFDGRAPGAHTLVSARIGGARSPELVALPDAELLELATAQLAPLLGARSAPTFFRVVRHQQALPQYTMGHAGRVAAVDAAEQREPGLYFTGNAYRGLGLPDCIRNAATLAARITRDLTARRAAA